MRQLSVAIWVVLTAVCGAIAAEGRLRCAVCQSIVSGAFYWYQPAGQVGKQPVCETCSKLESTCAVCRLPVRPTGRRLEDGRWLCEHDLQAGVFTQTEATHIYEETWRALQGILAGTGTLPRHNITVALVDLRELKKQNASLPSEHDDRTMMGLTRTRRSVHREFQHQIYLITGLGPSRLAAVCAHEYTHAWLHENVPPDRSLDRDTIEGFCELVAYKLMTLRGEEGEKSFILANAYTRGQVNAFVQAEAGLHFHRIVQWIKTGVDEVLPAAHSQRALAARRDDPTIPPWPPPPPLLTPVPERLVLKGISGSPSRRFALINDCTLQPNEEARVRVGSSNVVVRCLEIRGRSALIRVHGDQSPREIFLGSNE